MGTKTPITTDSLDDQARFSNGSGGKGQGDARPPKMRVKLFGGLNVTVAGEVLPDEAWSKNKCKLFFAHVVVRHGKAVSRDHIIECLWPDLDRASAVNNVYVTWSLVRRTIETACDASCYVNSNKSMYRINADLVESDVYEFDVLTRKMLFNDLSEKSMEQHVSRMEQIYAGDFLSGVPCDPYLLKMRNRYRDTYVDVLLAASSKMLARSNQAGSLWFARKAFGVDSRREDVYQALMRAQHASGQRVPAMETFFMCKSYLSDELGVPLSRKTLELYEQLLDDDDSAALV